MRILSYIVIAVGILMLVSNGYDEFRGVTTAPSMRVRSIEFHTGILTKKGNPEDFHNAMVYSWFMSSMIVAAGFILFAIDKSQERLDPMSADSDEKIDDELRKDEMDEK